MHEIVRADERCVHGTGRSAQEASVVRTVAISGSLPHANHTAGLYRESAALRGSTRGTLSAHDKVDTGKDGFHLSLRDFADSLDQLPLIDGHELRNIRDGIAI
jgi:hypothetical protein